MVETIDEFIVRLKRGNRLDAVETCLSRELRVAAMLGTQFEDQLHQLLSRFENFDPLAKTAQQSIELTNLAAVSRAYRNPRTGAYIVDVSALFMP